MFLAWKLLRLPPPSPDGTPGAPLEPRRDGPRKIGLLGTPVGLLLLFPVLYLAYMLYVRTTTALNQLDLRLLYPAYFPLLVLALVLIDRLRRLDTGEPGGDRWWRIGWTTAHVWAVANIAAGAVAMVGFAAGHPYFNGNYEADVFQQVRSNPALDALPADCTALLESSERPVPRLRRAVES